jgi:hypothetical protein
LGEKGDAPFVIAALQLLAAAWSRIVAQAIQALKNPPCQFCWKAV